MSKTSNKKPDGSPGPLLRSKTSGDIVQEKIQQRYLVEASRLFIESAPDIEKEERDALGEQIPTLIEQAEKYFLEGGNHEKERELEQARKKYEKVKTIAIDYPGLSESLRRVDDAIELIWALENSAHRRKGSKGKQSVVTKYKSRKSRLWRILSVCFFLQLIIIGAGLFYTDNLSFMPLKQYNSGSITQSDQSKPSESKEIRGAPADKKSEQAQKNTLRKKILPPVQLSSTFQINYKPEDTEASRKSSPELEEEGAKNLAGADSKQTRSTIPLNQQHKNSATILADQTTPPGTFYTVQKNDTLGLISQKKYGTFSQWPTIANANKDQLGGNPNRLTIGMILILPTLDETSKTLPRSGPPGSSQEP